jgi:glucose-1-phosphate thymidylyltransferase
MSIPSLKVVIPMAGLGTRLRPHTWSKPKQLVSVAGKTVLDHVINSLTSYPQFEHIELINIVGYLGDQIEKHVRENYPNIQSHFVIQENPKGQSHAIMLAREYLQGPMLMIFADTLIETDLSELDAEPSDGVVWVKPVDDPRRFGVAERGSDGCVKRLVEKPTDMKNNLAVVGFYYFKEAENLISAIDKQIERDTQLKGEYYLADAVNIMLDRGFQLRTESVEIWLDAGNRASLLETNRYLLAHGHGNSQHFPKDQNVVIEPPVFIHPSASINTAIIGPNVSIGAGCHVSTSIIQESILEDQAKADGVILTNSLVGRRAHIRRRAGEVNVGDNTEITF